MADDALQYIEASRKMPLMALPVRTVIVPVTQGRILFSPASTLTREQLLAAGDVAAIVAPNLLHLEGSRPAHEVFPKAQLWGPAGAADKEAGLPWKVLGQDAWPYEDELALVVLSGLPRFNESVFFHRATRTLLVTDLAFNIQEPKGFGAWLILSMFGTHGRFAVSRLFARMVSDRESFQRSLEKIFAFDFTTVVPSHGAPYEDDAKETFRRRLAERGLRVRGA